MNKSGFTLIELLVATFIASILAPLLFMAVYQINRAVPTIDNRSAIYEKAALIQAQLERDLSGVLAPAEYYARQPKAAQPKKPTPPPADKTPSPNQTKPAASPAPEKAEPEKEKIPLDKIFYSTNKNGMLHQLSFITTNSMQVYWSEKSGSAKPRVVRVVYTLKEDKAGKAFSLVRQESSNLEFSAFERQGKEAIPEYTLATDIKSMSAEYTAVIPEEKKDEAQQKLASAKKDIQRSKDFSRAASQQTESRLPLVPSLAKFTFAFWDAQKKRSVPFTFIVKIQSEVLERLPDDIGERMMGTLRDLFGQAFPQKNSNQVVAQSHRNSGNSMNTQRKMVRR